MKCNDSAKLPALSIETKQVLEEDGLARERDSVARRWFRQYLVVESITNRRCISSSLGLLFIFILINALPIESMSYHDSHSLVSNATANITLNRHCLLNAEMVDLHASVHSPVVLINVFFYTGIGLILSTIIICVLSIVLICKGAHLWNELREYHCSQDRISLRSRSPIVEYLRTYNTIFALGIIFVLLSIPCKSLRLTVLFASSHLGQSPWLNHVLVQGHSQMQTIGHAFELSLYSYKCFVCICTNHRFRCALKYLCRYQRTHVIIDPYQSSTDSYYRNTRLRTRHSEESVPLEVLYKHLHIDEFESAGRTQRIPVESGGRDQRFSLKTRSSVSSRRTKEEEISL